MEEARLRVLHVGKYFPPVRGGIEIFLKDLVEALGKAGVHCEALVHQPLARRPPTGQEGAVKVRRAYSFGEFLFAPVSPGFPVCLLSALAACKPDIVHLHLPNVSAFWILAFPKRFSGRIVIQWQSDVVPSMFERRLRLFYRFYRPFEQMLLKRASAIITSSEAYLDSSVPLRPWRGKCRSVPLGIDPCRLPWPGSGERIEAERGWGPESALRILAVGRLTYYKGFDVLLEAARILGDIRVQIVGEGARRGVLEEKLKRLDLEDRVFLRGELEDEDLRGLYATAHCLCLPSVERTEAFGMVLLEAMHYGLPVVASDIKGSGVGWVASQSPHCLLVPPGDALALAEALGRVSKRTPIKPEGGTHLPAIFHIQRCASEMGKIYREILLKGSL